MKDCDFSRAIPRLPEEDTGLIYRWILWSKMINDNAILIVLFATAFAARAQTLALQGTIPITAKMISNSLF